ncbi:hypothetical protein, variant [Aphanomyces invadans]|nr:hypothetical protein, variant [Aphanomyces invadans]ETW04763.1 hypothetical protein, variant [Aphanomyces invadans]|eukprot:XP_008866200.1 hypothetical protein, variant [Aphanomyces invadans]
MATILPAVRFRVGTVGPCHKYPSLMQIRRTSACTDVVIGNHGESSISRWTASTTTSPDGKAFNTFADQANVSCNSFPSLQKVHIGRSGEVIVAVSDNTIAWCDAQSLGLLYEHSIAPRVIQSSVCVGDGWTVVYATLSSEARSEIFMVSVAYRSPQGSTVSIQSCGSFPYISTFLFSKGDSLVVGGFAREGLTVLQIELDETPSSYASNSLPSKSLNDLFRDMQLPTCTVSREEFQTALWTALDINHDQVAICLNQTFPQSQYVDWLMDDLREWRPDDPTVTAQHARWITFQLMTNSTSFSATLWHEFRSANMVHILQLLLSQGALGRVQILWRRHVCLELVETFDVTLLPLDLHAATVTSWIQHEVLPAFHHYKVPIEKLALEIVERAKIIATEGDIEGALLWTTVVCPQVLPPERLWKQSALEKDATRHLHIQLQQLVHLGNQFDFYVSFEAFQAATVAGLAMAMLDRVQLPDMLPAELTSHVEPFLVIASNLTLDDILVDYVLEKAAEIPFDVKRCCILLDKIASLEKRAKSALVVLQSIPLPYLPSMLELAANAANWSSVFQMELQEQLRLMQLEELFRQYGLKYDIHDARLPARFCRYLCTQVDNPQAFGDALNLAQASHQLRKERVIVQHMQNVLLASWSDNRSIQLLQAIEAIEAPRKWAIAAEVVQFGLMYLDTLPHMSHLLLAFVSPLMAQNPIHRGFERVVNSTLQHALRQVDQLRALHNLPMSMNTYQSPSQHPELLESLLQPWLDALIQPSPSLKRKRNAPGEGARESRPMTTEGTNALTKTQQCSLLLGMSTFDFRAFLGVQAASRGDIDQALRFARNTNATVMKQVAVALLRYMVVSKQVNHRRLRIARELLVACTTHDTCSSMDQDVSLLKQVSLLCMINDHTADQSDARDELIHTYVPWRIYENWYRGAAITLNASVIPLALSYTMAQQLSSVHEHVPSASKQLVSYLVEVQAPQLTLSVLLNTTHVPEDTFEVLAQQQDLMLSQILYSHQIDRDLALGYMLSMDQQTAFSALNKRLVRENVYNDFARLQQLAHLGSQVARTWQQIGFLHICTELEVNSKWWHHLNLLGITCDHKAFRSDRRDQKAIQAVVPQLLEATSLDLYCALEFTRQYNIPDSVPCLLYVKALLLSSNDYTSRIVGVLEDVHEHELIPLLLSILPKLDGTDYDRLLFVFNLLQKTTYTEQDEVQNHIQVLHFLKHFTPKLSFHAIMSDPWSVLEAQLTAATVGQLVSLCSPLDIDADEMYMRLIKNMIEGDISSLSFELFRGILNNFSVLNHKITTAEWLSKKICHASFAIPAIEFALEISLSQPDHPKTTRLQQTLLQLKTEEIWNAMSQEFDGAPLPETPLDPKKLIEAIYFKYGQQAWSIQSSTVHDNAAKIAALHNAPLSKIQLDIRWKWLTARHQKPPQSVWRYDVDDEERTRLDRLLYISWTHDVQVVLQELVKYACDPIPRAGLTYRVKYRALQVVESIAQSLQFQADTFLPGSMSVSLTELKQSCRLLVLFEELQYPHALASFLKCDKESLVRGLWREHYQDPAVLVLISELMVAYSIANESLWHRVLDQMVTLSMFPTIFHLLRVLVRQFPSVDLKPFFEQAIMWPLQTLDRDVPPAHVDRVLQDIVFLIQQCPFIDSLKIAEIVHLLHTLSIQLPDIRNLAHYAVQCAFGIPQVTTRTTLLCQLCESKVSYVEPIFDYLANLSPLEVIDADFFVNYILEHPKAQETLIQSRHGQAYCETVARLADTTAMDHALAFLLQHHRLDDANEMIARHLRQFPQKKLQEALTPLQDYLLQTTSPTLAPFQMPSVNDANSQ